MRTGWWQTSDQVPLVSAGLSLGAGVGALVVVAVSLSTLACGFLGVCLLAAGLAQRSQLLFDVGAVALVSSLIFASFAGLPSSLILLAAFFTVAAWDIGRNAFSIASEIGTTVSTVRIELVHAISSIVVFAAGSSIGYAVFVGKFGQQSVLALAALLIGVFTLLIALQS